MNIKKRLYIFSLALILSGVIAGAVYHGGSESSLVSSDWGAVSHLQTPDSGMALLEECARTSCVAAKANEVAQAKASAEAERIAQAQQNQAAQDLDTMYYSGTASTVDPSAAAAAAREAEKEKYYQDLTAKAELIEKQLNCLSCFGGQCIKTC